ncbi:MAG: hypothetical protein WCB36_08490, partial [Burkholderiales bacterium]
FKGVILASLLKHMRVFFGGNVDISSKFDGTNRPSAEIIWPQPQMRFCVFNAVIDYIFNIGQQKTNNKVG